jgi:hypothetical protein
VSDDVIGRENEVLRGLLRRAQRHLVALGEGDRDAGYRDASLVALFRDWDKAGVYGGRALGILAESIEGHELRLRTKPPKAQKARKHKGP